MPASFLLGRSNTRAEPVGHRLCQHSRSLGCPPHCTPSCSEPLSQAWGATRKRQLWCTTSCGKSTSLLCPELMQEGESGISSSVGNSSGLKDTFSTGSITWKKKEEKEKNSQIGVSQPILSNLDVLFLSQWLRICICSHACTQSVLLQDSLCIPESRRS